MLTHITASPFISLIVPVYNCEHYIRLCVESLITGFKGSGIIFEILLINDGSKDNSYHECTLLAHEHPRIRVFTGTNQGASAARNIGLDNANGRYIWFIDADDYINPNSIASILSCLINDAPSVLTFNHAIKNTDSEFIVQTFKQHENIRTLTFLKQNTALYLWNKIYDSQIIGDIRFLHGTKNLEDFLFNIMVLCRIQTLATLPVVGYTYNNSNVFSTSRSRTARNLIKLSQDSLTIHSVLKEMQNDNGLDCQVRETVRQLLNFSIGGHIFSLLKFYNYKRLIKVIDIYHREKLYPIGKSSNRKMNLFIKLVNRRFLLRILSLSLKRL